MAGKSNKNRNRKGTANSAKQVPAVAPVDGSVNAVDPNVAQVNPPLPDNNGGSVEPENNEVVVEAAVSNEVVVEAKSSGEVVVEAESSSEIVAAAENSVSTEVDPKASDSENVPKQGELHLYPVSVKTFGGEKLELQLNPGDSVMDVRQFLLDAPETCFFTSYDLLLHTKDGAVHSLEDYNEISEVADITTGDCTLEMVSASYDDRSVRFHVHRTRELLSVSSLHASLSTSLALQHESSRSTPESKEGSVKAVPELDGFGFVEDVTGSLGKLCSCSSKEVKCVESLVFSSFNPPPSHRRLVGDLIYLDVVTLEGGNFCITGTTRMFYVNSTVGNSLDPKPAKSAFEATTIIGLLQKISPKFKKAFKEILDQKASAHPFENVQSFLTPNSWLASYPLPGHTRDAARAENALTLTYGSELIGMQRDWNEELQSCREFPHTSPQERILRSRALYKVTSDFVEAAMNGAIGVINRCIPPINPTDPECFHMYVHNNIFFSFAVDADLEQLPRKHKPKSNVKHNSSGKILDKQSDAATVVGNGVEANASPAEDENGAAAESSDVPAEIQLVDTEQATYASANNDLKGTKAYQEADVPGLYNLAMAIIDYRGHRVVAQSVLPGILQGDKSDSLLYGSVDNGKKICWNEDFHSKVLEAAKRLHLKEHSVSDDAGHVFKLAAPVECKGIVGSDDRHYLLDLMRVTPRDANYTGTTSRFCILRPELIKAFCLVEAAKRSSNKSNCDEKDCLASEASEPASAEVDVQTDSCEAAISNGQDVSEESSKVPVEDTLSTDTETSDEISFNPNVFTDFKLAGSPEEIASDKESVKEASLYLANVVLPAFTQDLCKLEVSPMDGQTLTEALHAHGINVRYIGKVAEGTKHMPHLWDLCVNEIAVRSAKHLLKDVLRDTEEHELAPAMSHFFNCFFGDYQAAVEKSNSNNLPRRSQKKEHGGQQKSSRGKSRWKNGTSARTSTPSYLGLSSERLWSEIVEFAKFKYQFDMPDDARTRVKKIPVIRNLCLKVGISLTARKYDLDTASPFQTSDIVDLKPVVKHSVPVCSEAKDLLDTGKLQLSEGLLGEAYTSFSEAFAMLQQVTGPMHREVANCCRYLAMVLYHATDMAGAIMQQHKELIINERCLGLDHPDTAHSYGNMALFYHGLNQTELALHHMSRALLLLSLSSGPDHPDVAATFINVAMMCQDTDKMGTTLRYLQEALKKNERLLGEEHIQTAVCYHALAIAFDSMNAYKLSHQHEKKTYEILVKQLGEEDARTRESLNWIERFRIRELQKQSAQTLGLKQAFNSIQARANSGVPLNKSLSNKGKGQDEKGARAAAAIKKKASAKGHTASSSQAGMASNNDEEVIKHENTVTDKTTDGSSPSTEGTQQAAPVGLGKGLSSLSSKKQESKSK